MEFFLKVNMKKLLGYIFNFFLILGGAVMLLPSILGAVCFWAAIKIRCWSKGEHTYDPQQIFNGLPLKSMRCTKCYKLISPGEEARVQTQIDLYIISLKQSREFLNEVFNTPEERAVDKLIQEASN